MRQWGPCCTIKPGSWRFIKPVYEDKVPACQNACPAGNDIEGWIRLLERKEYERAYWHLKREEPFPAILGRVCFSFCEDACNRAGLDQCVDIKELERFIGDQVPASKPHPEIPAHNGKHLAVVGSGPAGMSAAYFARLLGFEVTIFERNSEPGGILRVGIPAYRLPKDIVDAEFQGLAAMGVEIRTDTEIGTDLPLSRLLDAHDYVFLGTGAHRSIPLGLSGENRSPHVMSGLRMLNAVAAGGKIDLGTQVIVIGGGNTAIDAARTAIRLGSEVTVLYRRSEAEMPAHPEEVHDAREEGVEFTFLAAPQEIILDNDGRIDHLLCNAMELGPPDESGRRRPVKKEDSDFRVVADTVISAIGEKTDIEYADQVIPINDMSIPVDNTMAVQEIKSGGRAKVFAGGDVTDTARTVVHAVACGKRAAIAMDCDRQGVDPTAVLEEIAIGYGQAVSFAKYKGWANLQKGRRNDREVVESDQIVFDYFNVVPQPQRAFAAGQDRRASFEPFKPTFTEKEAQASAIRCMHCGRCTECDNCLIFCPDVSVLLKGDQRFGYDFDYDYCKGCGICFTECPRHAISMVSQDTSLEEEG